MHTSILFKRQRISHFVSTFLIFSFLFQELSYASADPNTLTALWPSSVLKFKIPESIATVEDSFNASPTNKVVYLIQDAHTNESAQKNIAKAIDLILQREPVRYVFLEAGTGDDSLSFLRKSSTAEKRQTVAKSYLKKGTIQGPDYLDLTSDRPFMLWGVEDKSLYFKGLECYRFLKDKRSSVNSYLDNASRTTETLKTKIFTPSLLVFEQKRAAFLKNEITLTDYIEFLMRVSKSQRVKTSEFAHIEVLKELKEKESQIDFVKASEQQVRAIAALSAEDQKELLGLASHKNTPFKLDTTEHKAERGFYALLEEKLIGRTRRIYPELFKYFSYLNLAQKLNAKQILEEKDDLEILLYAALAKTPDEMRLVQVSQAQEVLRKLLNLTATTAEYEEIEKDPKRFDIVEISGFLNKEIMDLGSHYEEALFLDSSYDEALKYAKQFYSLTFQRDEVFVRNMLQKMLDTDETKAVLVTGGFHTEHLKQLLKEKNISFVSITPQILQETNQVRYEKILLSQAEGRRWKVEGNDDFLSVLPAAELHFAASRFSVLDELKKELGEAISTGARLADQEPTGAHSSQTINEIFQEVEHEFKNSVAALSGYLELDLNDLGERIKIPADLKRPQWPQRPKELNPTTVLQWAEDSMKELDRVEHMIPAICDFFSKEELEMRSEDFKEDLESYYIRIAEDARHVLEPILHIGKPEQPQVLDVNELIAQVVLSQQGRGFSTYANVERPFTTLFTPRLPLVKISAPRLREVLVNLIRNAAQAIPRGGMLHGKPFQGKITISSDYDPSAHQVVISVEDNGVGIRKENLQKIWQTGYTLKPDGIKGTGFGLGICRAIIQEYGGQIEDPVSRSIQEFPEGHGTVFKVRLPVNVFLHHDHYLNERDFTDQKLDSGGREILAPLLKKAPLTPQMARVLQIRLDQDPKIFRWNYKTVLDTRVLPHSSSQPGFEGFVDSFEKARFSGETGLLSIEFHAANQAGRGDFVTYLTDLFERVRGQWNEKSEATVFLDGVLKIFRRLAWDKRLGTPLERNVKALAAVRVLEKYLRSRIMSTVSAPSNAARLSLPPGYRAVKNEWVALDVLNRAYQVVARLQSEGVNHTWLEKFERRYDAGSAVNFKLWFEGKILYVSDNRLTQLNRDIVLGISQDQRTVLLKLPSKPRELYSLDEQAHVEGVPVVAGARLASEARPVEVVVIGDGSTPKRTVIGRAETLSGLKEEAVELLYLIDARDSEREIENFKPFVQEMSSTVAEKFKMALPLATASSSMPSETAQDIKELVKELKWGLTNGLAPEEIDNVEKYLNALSKDAVQTVREHARQSPDEYLNGPPAVMILKILNQIESVDPKTQHIDYNGTSYSKAFLEILLGVVRLRSLGMAKFFYDRDSRVFEGDEKEKAINLVKQELKKVAKIVDRLVNEVTLEQTTLEEASRGREQTKKILATKNEALDAELVLKERRRKRLSGLLKKLQTRFKRSETLLRNGQKKRQVQSKLSPGILESLRTKIAEHQKRLRTVQAEIRKLENKIDKNKSILDKTANSELDSSASEKMRQQAILILGSRKMMLTQIKQNFLEENKLNQTAEWMVKNNRSFVSLLYERFSLKLLNNIPKLVGGKKSQMGQSFMDTIELLKGLFEAATPPYQRKAKRIQLQSGAHQEDVIVWIRESVDAKVIMGILRKYPQIQGIIATQATIASHWVVVVQGLPNPPRILVVHDEKEIQKLQEHFNLGETIKITRDDKGQDVLIVHPEESMQENTDLEQERQERFERLARSMRYRRTPFPILANGTPDHLESLEKDGVDGVGLIRTEFWDEAFQRILIGLAQDTSSRKPFEFLKDKYRLILDIPYLSKRLRKRISHGRKLSLKKPMPVKFRTWDIQWDKNKELLVDLKDHHSDLLRHWQTGEDLPDNKITGFNFYHTQFGRQLLTQQIAAIYAANQDFKEARKKARFKPETHIVLPGVRSKEDLDYILYQILPLAAEITGVPADLPVDQKIKILTEDIIFDTMIENTDALNNIQEILQHPLVHALSVGNNDLTLDILRGHYPDIPDISRDDPRYEHLFAALDPEVLEKIEQLAQVVAVYNTEHPESKKELGFCGEIAGTTKFLLFIAYLHQKYGIPVYDSMSSTRVPIAKFFTRQIEEETTITDTSDAHRKYHSKRLPGETKKADHSLSTIFNHPETKKTDEEAIRKAESLRDNSDDYAPVRKYVGYLKAILTKAKIRKTGKLLVDFFKEDGFRSLFDAMMKQFSLEYMVDSRVTPEKLAHRIVAAHRAYQSYRKLSATDRRVLGTFVYNPTPSQGVPADATDIVLVTCGYDKSSAEDMKNYLQALESIRSAIQAKSARIKQKPEFLNFDYKNQAGQVFTIMRIRITDDQGQALNESACLSLQQALEGIRLEPGVSTLTPVERSTMTRDSSSTRVFLDHHKLEAYKRRLLKSEFSERFRKEPDFENFFNGVMVELLSQKHFRNPKIGVQQHRQEILSVYDLYKSFIGSPEPRSPMIVALDSEFFVLAEDRKGLTGDITTAIASLGINIEDQSDLKFSHPTKDDKHFIIYLFTITKEKDHSLGERELLSAISQRFSQTSPAIAIGATPSVPGELGITIMSTPPADGNGTQNAARAATKPSAARLAVSPTDEELRNKAWQTVLKQPFDYREAVLLLLQFLEQDFVLGDIVTQWINDLKTEVSTWGPRTFTTKQRKSLEDSLGLIVLDLKRKPEKKIVNLEKYIVLLGTIFQKSRNKKGHGKIRHANMAESIIQKIIEGVLTDEVANEISLTRDGRSYHLWADSAVKYWEKWFLHKTPHSLYKAENRVLEEYPGEIKDQKDPTKRAALERSEQLILKAFDKIEDFIRSSPEKSVLSMVNFRKLMKEVTVIGIESPTPVLLTDSPYRVVRAVSNGRRRQVFYIPLPFLEKFDLNNDHDIKELASFLYYMLVWNNQYQDLSKKAKESSYKPGSVTQVLERERLSAKEIYEVSDKLTKNFTLKDDPFASADEKKALLLQLMKKSIVSETTKLVPTLLARYRRLGQEESSILEQLRRYDETKLFKEVNFVELRDKIGKLAKDLGSLGIYFEMLGNLELAKEMFEKRDHYVVEIQRREPGLYPTRLEFDLVYFYLRRGETDKFLFHLENLLGAKHLELVTDLDEESREIQRGLFFMLAENNLTSLEQEIDYVLGSLRSIEKNEEKRQELLVTYLKAKRMLHEFRRIRDSKKEKDFPASNGSVSGARLAQPLLKKEVPASEGARLAEEKGTAVMPAPRWYGPIAEVLKRVTVYFRKEINITYAKPKDIDAILEIQKNSPADPNIYLEKEQILKLIENRQVLIAEIRKKDGRWQKAGAIFMHSSLDPPDYAAVLDPSQHSQKPSPDEDLYDFWIIVDKNFNKTESGKPVFLELLAATIDKAQRLGKKAVVAYSRAGGAWKNTYDEFKNQGESIKNFYRRIDANKPLKAAILLHYLLTTIPPKTKNAPAPRASVDYFINWLKETDHGAWEFDEDKFEAVLNPESVGEQNKWNPANDLNFVFKLGVLLRKFLDDPKYKGYLPVDATIGGLHSRNGASLRRIRLDSRPGDRQALGSNVEMSYDKSLPSLVLDDKTPVEFKASVSERNPWFVEADEKMTKPYSSELFRAFLLWLKRRGFREVYLPIIATDKGKEAFFDLALNFWKKIKSQPPYEVYDVYGKQAQVTHRIIRIYLNRLELENSQPSAARLSFSALDEYLQQINYLNDDIQKGIEGVPGQGVPTVVVFHEALFHRLTSVLKAAREAIQENNKLHIRDWEKGALLPALAKWGETISKKVGKLQEQIRQKPSEALLLKDQIDLLWSKYSSISLAIGAIGLLDDKSLTERALQILHDTPLPNAKGARLPPARLHFGGDGQARLALDQRLRLLRQEGPRQKNRVDGKIVSGIEIKADIQKDSETANLERVVVIAVTLEQGESRVVIFDENGGIQIKEGKHSGGKSLRFGQFSGDEELDAIVRVVWNDKDSRHELKGVFRDELSRPEWNKEAAGQGRIVANQLKAYFVRIASEIKKGQEKGTTPAARLSVSTKLENLFIGVAQAATPAVMNGSRLAVDLEKSSPTIFQLTVKQDTLVALAEHTGNEEPLVIKLDVSKQALATSRLEKNNKNPELSIQDLRSMSDAVDSRVAELLDPVEISNSTRLVMEVDPSFLPVDSFDFYAEHLISVFENLRQQPYGQNIVFQAVGPMADKLSSLNPDAESLFVSRLPADFLLARKVRLALPNNLKPDQVNLPINQLKEGDVPAFKAVARLAVYLGRIDLSRIPQPVEDAYTTLAGERPESGLLKLILTANAKLEILTRYSLKPLIKVPINQAIQFFRLVKRMVAQAA